MDYESTTQMNDEIVAQLLAQFNSTTSGPEPQSPPQNEDALPEYALAQQALASHALFGNASTEDPATHDLTQDTVPEHAVIETPQTMEGLEVDKAGGLTAAQSARAETADHIPQATQLPQIEIPFLADTHEYEFLPGHFEVRCVISETDSVNEIYKVKLRSGETETVGS